MKDILHTFRVEWLKVKYYRTFWILLAIVVVCIPSFNYVVYDFTDNTFPKVNGVSLLGNPFSFPNVWKMIPYNAGILVFMPALLIITLFTNEFTFKTHRQNIIDGWSRSRFILVKLSEVFLLALFVTGIVVLTALYFGFLTKKGIQPGSTWHEVRFIFYYFIGLVDYSLIAVIFAMLIKRSGLALGLFFLYMFLEQFVVAISRNKYKQEWVNYLPEEVSDRLIPNPIGGRMLQSTNQQYFETHLPSYLVVSLLYILIFIIFISWRFRKSDL